jgi:hypothetical protein
MVDEKRQKGNRNQVEGKQLIGFEDQFIGDGSKQQRTFRPLLFRTYRYLQITIETKGEPLEIHDLIGHFTATRSRKKPNLPAATKALQPSGMSAGGRRGFVPGKRITIVRITSNFSTPAIRVFSRLFRCTLRATTG